MTYKELIEKAGALVRQAQQLMTEGGDKMTAEQGSQVDQWLKEAQDLARQADEVKGGEDRAERLEALNAHLNQKAGGPGGAKAPASPSGFKHWGEIFVAVKRGNDPRLESAENLYTAEERKGMAEGSGLTGGFLVPAEFRPELLESAAEGAIVRPRATPVPMASRSVEIPALDQTTAQAAGTSAFFGGVAVEWFEENADLAEQNPKFKQIELVVHGVGGWMPVSNQLLAHSAISLSALVPRLFGGSVGWVEDYCFLRGDGRAKPLGILLSPALKSFTRTTASHFKFTDAVGMLASFLTSSWTRGVWAMSPTVIPDLYAMTDSLGANVWLPNAAAAGPGMLLGIPIAFTEKLPALGTAGDVLLCDCSYYLIGDGEGVAIEASTHERFRKNQTTFRVTKFVDGQPWLDAPITLADGSTTVSPFVAMT